MRMLDIGCCAKFGGGGGFATGMLRSAGAVSTLQSCPYILRLLKVLGPQYTGHVGSESRKRDQLTSLCCYRGFLQHGAAVSLVGY